MNSQIVKVKITDDFKKEAMQILYDTIEKVLYKKKTSLNDNDKIKIKNLTLDQINVNISHRNRTKTMWVFDVENFIPVIVKTPKKKGNINEYIKSNNDNYFHMQSNLNWTFKKENQEFGKTYEEFEEQVLETLLEDFETAAFYGTLSYVNE